MKKAGEKEISRYQDIDLECIHFSLQQRKNSETKEREREKKEKEQQQKIFDERTKEADF